MTWGQMHAIIKEVISRYGVDPRDSAEDIADECVLAIQKAIGADRFDVRGMEIAGIAAFKRELE